jgi:bacillithiol biosynthesis deacetylase BshB1
MQDRWSWKEGNGRVEVLALGAHPDDVELGCGGTLALLAKRGTRTGIAHLTRGEAGTRGTEEERRVEAEAAARALGAATLDILDCGDGGLRSGEEEEEALIELLRLRRPELLLLPSPSDRHPDHGRAHELLRAAAFYSGLAARGEGEPHRPGAAFSYMQHDPFDPSFVVDVSASWEQKLAALAAYRSQLHQEGEARDEPATKVASPEFRHAVEGRARHFGLLIGAAFGEPFFSPLPLAVSDPRQLVPGGLR